MLGYVVVLYSFSSIAVSRGQILYALYVVSIDSLIERPVINQIAYKHGSLAATLFVEPQRYLAEIWLKQLLLIAGKRFGKLLKQLLYTILLLLAPSGFFISAFASGATITIFKHRTTNTKGYDRYHTGFFMDSACFGITLRR
ncbi:BDM_1a_G0024090.mRNA.1.CDS.1 [Saccharomyces cerevisiae]|nr:BDM_1a_G0024090.mRNA.1.CDS.1 [Saccharomyces cerevisiae]CAI7152664.1 BDM_1a_G0024090.mRNA.1.CDS.1 [Saccharomyces cerevisiae]